MNRRDMIAGGFALVCASAVRGAPAPGARAFSPAITRYEAESGGHVGVFARNVRTGAQLAWRADQRFVMCSTFKASLAALVLHRAQQGRDSLDDRIALRAADIPDWHAPVARANAARGFMTVRDMAAAIVVHSDNTCANLLLERVGGPKALTAFWRSLGDRTSRLDAYETELNWTAPGGVESTTSPRAMADTMQKLVLGDALAGSSRAMLKRWLIDCQTGANRLRAGLPREWVTGDKTGNNGKDAAGDLAVSWVSPDQPLVLVVYTRGGTPTPAQLDALFKGIGRDAANRLAALTTRA